jgi:3-oxoacyl-[acyl-carrier protein] reductase
MVMTVCLDDQVAVVTGAARNIGKRIAETLAANGARVVFTDTVAADAAAAAAGCDGAIGFAMDVSDEASVERGMADIVARYGRIDIVVNNAGINPLPRVTVDQLPRAVWDQVLSVDLTGLYLVSRAAAKQMRTQGSGRIINITSVLGVVPARLQSAFVAAKGGVCTFTKAMAIELGADGILVNAIAPGSIPLNGNASVFSDDPEKARRMLSHVPLGRAGTTEDIAHAALFLAAPESRYITGQVLAVDGGWTAGYMRDF